jgi:hypothetical protein
MPTELKTDDSLPQTARRFPLAASLLSAWEHEGSLLGDIMGQDALRQLKTREMLGVAV